MDSTQKIQYVPHLHLKEKDIWGEGHKEKHGILSLALQIPMSQLEIISHSGRLFCVSHWLVTILITYVLLQHMETMCCDGAPYDSINQPPRK